MCDICVMNSVKERMLSRRDLFRSAGAAATVATVGAAAASISAPAAMAQGHDRVEDMTHTLSHEFPTYFGRPGISLEQQFAFEKDGFNLFEMTVNEHTGTHVDAPLHFSADGMSVDEIPVSSLVAPLCVVDIAQKASGDVDAQVTPEDIQAWIDQHGDIPDGACVAMHSGWAAHLGTPKFRGTDGDAQHYPGFHVDAAEMLIEETGAGSIAVDTLSLDHGISPDFATHYAWLPSGRFGVECLAGLDRVPASGATLIVGAPKHKGGSGGPARIFAMV